MRRNALISTALLVTGLAAALSAAPRTPPSEPTMPELPAATSVNAFAADLLKRVAASGGNVFVSPHSIVMALAMVRAGAKGETAREFDAVLHLPPDAPARFRELTAALVKEASDASAPGGRSRRPPPEHRLSIANGLFTQSGWPFKEAFRSTIGADYGAEFREVDFHGDHEGARAAINGWVEEKTAQRIKEIVPSGLPTPDTRMVLANAIHFKAQWLEPFSESSTRDGPFTVAAGREVTAKRMRRTDHFMYGETPTAQVVEIPYCTSTSMVVVLPKENDGLDALVRDMTSEGLSGCTKGLAERKLALELPKFTFTTALSLLEVLEAMGIRAAFSAEQADFTLITEKEGLCVGAVLHKAFVAVDEKGTEAAAATVVAIRMAAAPPDEKPLPFVVDHPFLFFIRQRATGAILFVGRVTDPTAS